jgi:hypothetical protein
VAAAEWGPQAPSKVVPRIIPSLSNMLRAFLF